MSAMLMNLFDEASLSAAVNFISVILAILDQRLIASMRSLYSETVRATPLLFSLA
jgi:hypothetical protein